jgi:hydrogenase-4 component B
MDQLGGLAKTMPVTSVLFMVGALSICGLPLFNGFISEFIIFFGLFQGIFGLPLPGVVMCSLGILSLALMGALALACFSKVYGTVFLGKPRSVLTEEGSGWPLPIKSGNLSLKTEEQEVVCPEKTSKWMLIPMMILAGACVWIGLDPHTMTRLTFLGGADLTHVDLSTINLEQVLIPLAMVISTALLFIGLILGLIIVRRLLLGPVSAPIRETWSCGFAQVSARFQYTSSSFARLIIEFARNPLLVHRHGGQVTGVFPGKTHLSTSVHDASEEMLFRPALAFLTDLSRKIDNSRIRYTQIYLMYIFLFLIFLLVWKLK